MLRRRSLLPVVGGLLASPAVIARAQAPARQGPPHEWMFGSWTGGIFPAVETEGPGCFGNVSLIVTRDVIMRVSSLDISFRQRAIETVALIPNGLEFRLVPVQGRIPEIGFGCDNNPNLLRVQRRSDDEVVLPNCVEFPSALRRCKG
ncbi:hypothetical protein [Roseococcus sp. YIM B11640]|uniref:hypothetical protein n=1 Tax=Roseococcus sp. YIM B11640 TaxID=3133973 RepID=UPI003C7DA487